MLFQTVDVNKVMVEGRIRENRWEITNEIRLYLEEKYKKQLVFLKSEIQYQTQLMTTWEGLVNGEFKTIKVSYNVSRSQSVMHEESLELLDYDMNMARLGARLDSMIIL